MNICVISPRWLPMEIPTSVNCVVYQPTSSIYFKCTTSSTSNKKGVTTTNTAPQKLIHPWPLKESLLPYDVSADLPPRATELEFIESRWTLEYNSVEVKKFTSKIYAMDVLDHAQVVKLRHTTGQKSQPDHPSEMKQILTHGILLVTSSPTIQTVYKLGAWREGYDLLKFGHTQGQNGHLA